MNNALTEIAALENKAKGYRNRANQASQDKAEKLGQIKGLDKQESDIITKIKAQGLDPEKLGDEEVAIRQDLTNRFAQIDTMLPDANGVFPQQPALGEPTQDINVSIADAALDNIPT